MKIAIIGASARKFGPGGASVESAKNLIRTILKDANKGDIIITGDCHNGGVDSWTKEIAADLGLATEVYRPDVHEWAPIGKTGYRWKSREMAKNAATIHILVVKQYPTDFKGYRYPRCYHCNKVDHIKAGACWTGQMAGLKKVTWHILEEEK